MAPNTSVDAVSFVILSATPFFEARYAIPLALASGWNPIAAWILGTLVSMATAAVLLVSLDTIDRILQKIPFTRGLWTKYVDKNRQRLSEKLKDWKEIGIALFVAVPVPGTGVYSGSVAAYGLKIPVTKAMVLISAGAAVANAITLFSALGIIRIFAP